MTRESVNQMKPETQEALEAMAASIAKVMNCSMEEARKAAIDFIGHYNDAGKSTVPTRSTPLHQTPSATQRGERDHAG